MCYACKWDDTGEEEDVLAHEVFPLILLTEVQLNLLRELTKYIERRIRKPVAKFFADHPTVPRDSIVAMINMDQMGRGGPEDEPPGGPNSLVVLGTRFLYWLNYPSFNGLRSSLPENSP